MPEIRASTIDADDDSGNPLLVYRDANGVLRPVPKVERIGAWVVRGNRGDYEDALVIEVDHA